MKLPKQFQQNAVRDSMAKIDALEDSLQDYEYSATSGGVTIIVNGAGETLSVSLAEDWIDWNDHKSISNSILEASKKAFEQANNCRKEVAINNLKQAMKETH